ARRDLQDAPWKAERRLRSSCAGLSGEFVKLARAERNFQELNSFSRQIERILDRLREQRSDRDCTGLARTLDSQRIERRRRRDVAELDARDLKRGGQEIVGE